MLTQVFTSLLALTLYLDCLRIYSSRMSRCLCPPSTLLTNTEKVGSTGHWEYDGAQEHTGPALTVSGRAGVEWIEKYVSNKPKKHGSRAWLLWSQVLSTSGLSRPPMQTSLPSPGTSQYFLPQAAGNEGNHAWLFLTNHGTFLWDRMLSSSSASPVCGLRNDCNAITQSLVIGTDQQQHLGLRGARLPD